MVICLCWNNSKPKYKILVKCFLFHHFVSLLSHICSCCYCSCKTYMFMSNTCFRLSSSSIWAENTPKAPLISESASSRPSWRTKTRRIRRKSRLWWPKETLSSMSCRLSTTWGNIEPWRRDTTRNRGPTSVCEPEPTTQTPKSDSLSEMNVGESLVLFRTLNLYLSSKLLFMLRSGIK